MKKSIAAKSREQKMKEIDDRNLYSDLMKKVDIENKRTNRELSAKEVIDKKQKDFTLWRQAKDEKRTKFQIRAQNYMQELDRQRE